MSKVINRLNDIIKFYELTKDFDWKPIISHVDEEILFEWVDNFILCAVVSFDFDDVGYAYAMYDKDTMRFVPGLKDISTVDSIPDDLAEYLRKRQPL